MRLICSFPPPPPIRPSLAGDGHQRHVAAQNGQSRRGRAHPRHPRSRVDHRGHRSRDPGATTTFRSVDGFETRLTVAIPLQAFDSAEVPKIRSTPEELVRVTKPITLATAKAVAAGNSCRQDDVIVAANVGRKAISDMLTVCKVSNQSFDDLDAVDPPPPKKKKKKALLVELFSPGHCNVPDYSTRTPPQSRATDTRRYCATLVETEREREREREKRRPGAEFIVCLCDAGSGLRRRNGRVPHPDDAGRPADGRAVPRPARAGAARPGPAQSGHDAREQEQVRRRLL